jgi:3-hydroxyisobutyrate dehydrogenase
MKAVSLFGTGLLGAAVAQRFLERGYRVVVWNRTKSKADDLAASGATVAASPAEALLATNVSVLFLADATAIRETLLGVSTREALASRTVIQMGTISPRDSESLEIGISAAGGEYFEAPVLGSIPQALEGSLSIMVGSSEQQFERWRELFEAIGKPSLVGPVGKAAALKLALNHLIGTLTASFSASLALVRKNGIPVDLFMEILRSSAFYAPTFDKKLDRMLLGVFSSPNFPSQHLRKDMDLFADAAQSQGIDASLARDVSQILTRAIEQGFASADYSVLSRVVSGEADGRPVHVSSTSDRGKQG